MAYANGYTYRRTITVDHTKVSTENQTNFPVLVAGTYSYLAHTTHSGLVTNTSGFDIIFTSDAAGSTQLHHEIESYNHETGAVNFWVEAPSLSFETDTVIYMFYTNASVSTSQENVTGTWDSNFKRVFHMKETSGTALVDSIGVGNLTKVGATEPNPTTAGAVNGGQDFDGSNDFAESKTLTNLSSLTGTIEFWFNMDSGALDENAVFAICNDANANRSEILIDFDGRTPGSDNIILDVRKDGIRQFALRTDVESLHSWIGGLHHFTFIHDGSNAHILVDGNEVNSTLDASPPDVTAWFKAVITDATNKADTLAIGTVAINGTNYIFPDGKMDEVRIHTLNRTVGWGLTNFNSQSSPSTFYTVGDQTKVATDKFFPFFRP